MPEPFESVGATRLRISTGCAGPLRPGRLLCQHRYQRPDGADPDEQTTSFETRVGLVIGVHPAPKEADTQVDVWWSDWAPSDEPPGLAASRRIREGARARSAN